MLDNSEFDSLFSHHTSRCNGINIHYVMGGKGKPVLLWHGFLETWYCWRKIMPALAEKYTVIAPDMRGYGDSKSPTIENCGHFIASEQPEKLLEQLFAFLKKIED